jgi:hypothetical protein
MVLLCASTTIVRGSTAVADASVVARTITKHIKETIDPSYHALQKELKADAKKEHSLAKQELRAAQKKLQDACSEEKKALQKVCNAKKRALYSDYCAGNTEGTECQPTRSALLKTLRKTALSLAKTLKAVFKNAQEYLEALIQHGEQTQSTELLKTAHEELSWLDTLEKATRKSGIPFDEEFVVPTSSKRKTKRTTQLD